MPHPKPIQKYEATAVVFTGRQRSGKSTVAKEFAAGRTVYMLEGSTVEGLKRLARESGEARKPVIFDEVADTPSAVMRLRASGFRRVFITQPA